MEKVTYFGNKGSDFHDYITERIKAMDENQFCKVVIADKETDDIHYSLLIEEVLNLNAEQIMDTETMDVTFCFNNMWMDGGWAITGEVKELDPLKGENLFDYFLRMLEIMIVELADDALARIKNGQMDKGLIVAQYAAEMDCLIEYMQSNEKELYGALRFVDTINGMGSLLSFKNLWAERATELERGFKINEDGIKVEVIYFSFDGYQAKFEFHLGEYAYDYKHIYQGLEQVVESITPKCFGEKELPDGTKTAVGFLNDVRKETNEVIKRLKA